MLNSDQIRDVWESMIRAETRSLYFADLALKTTRRKQWIAGSVLFLSSGAAVSIVAKAPVWVATGLSLVVAATTAYSIFANLDAATGTLTKLHIQWQQICTDCEQLWSHTYSDDAEDRLQAIRQREKESSVLALTSAAPYNEKEMIKWERRVFKLRKLEEQRA